MTLLERATRFSLRRPAVTLALAALAAALSVLGLARLEYISDVARMLPTEGARTLTRVAEVFGTGERAYVLVETEDGDREADLIRFADGLRERLVGQAGIVGVTSGSPVSTGELLTALLLPYGPLFLEPSQLEALLTPAGLRERLEQQASRLALLGLGEVETWVERDPLDLHRSFAARAASTGRGLRMARDSSHALSADRRALLVDVESARGASSQAEARAVVEAVEGAIGVDDGIHLVHRSLQQGGPLAKSLRGTASAVVLTSLTTMLAFGSLAFSENQGIASVGALSFFGVGSCLLATVFVLPAALALRDRRSP